MKAWINGVVSAAISGAATGASVVAIDPDHFNPLTGGLSKLGVMALTGALVGTINHIRQSPFPGFGVAPALQPKD